MRRLEPSSNLHSQSFHESRVETEVVDRRETTTERVVHAEQVSQITPGMIGTERTITARIHWREILREPLIVYIDRFVKIPRRQLYVVSCQSFLPKKESPMPPFPRRDHTVEHVPPECVTTDDVLGRADTERETDAFFGDDGRGMTHDILCLLYTSPSPRD